MQSIVVGQDRVITNYLVEQLCAADFKVMVLENSFAVLGFIKKASLQFLVAEATVLLDQHLGQEVLKRCPLARLVAFSSRPSRIEMVDSLVHGLVDYFPRQIDIIPELVQAMIRERDKILRWQKTLLFATFSPDTSGGNDNSRKVNPGG